jgi:hypothetical protein
MDLAARRLAAQRISTPTFTRPSEVVTWLGAVQAQDYLGALWAVGLRLADAREADIERALADREIVRMWPMRGTLHFVAATDARWMTELLAPRAAASAEGRLHGLGIDAKVLARAARVLGRALEGGCRLTRPEAYAELARAKIATEAGRGMHILWRLAHDMLICFGPRAGKQQTLVLFDEWLPSAPRRPREQALAELAARYFTGHGPATVADFAWWSGLALRDARLAIELAGTHLEPEDLDGARYWSATAAPAAPASRRAYLLPPFDELLVGYTDRSAYVDPAHSRRVNAGGGILNATIVAGDRVVGTWKRRLGRRAVAVEIAPFLRIERLHARAVDAELARYARFLGLSLATDAV